VSLTRGRGPFFPGDRATGLPRIASASSELSSGEVSLANVKRFLAREWLWFVGIAAISAVLTGAWALGNSHYFAVHQRWEWAKTAAIDAAKIPEPSSIEAKPSPRVKNMLEALRFSTAHERAGAHFAAIHPAPARPFYATDKWGEQWPSLFVALLLLLLFVASTVRLTLWSLRAVRS